MRFVFDERRAAQAAARLLDKHGGTMPYIKLVKLLYLADRAALVEGGRPITGDRFVSVRHGPALARVLDLITDDCPAGDSVWHGYVARKRFDACLVGPADNEWLSEYNMGILDGISETYGCLKEWDVVARTHALPEWKDPGDTVIPIEPEDILRYSGYSDAEVESVVDDIGASFSLHLLLTTPATRALAPYWSARNGGSAMRFVFDERRAAQAAARLLDQHGGTMPWLKLVKLLYLADHAALVEGGWPITGDRFVSVRHGPALARVLELITDDCPAGDSIWHGYVARKRFDACLAGDTDDGWLSEHDRGILDGVFETYGCLKEWDVVARTHALPEWKDPGDTIIPIEPEDILRYAGYSEKAIGYVADQAEASYSLHTTLERIGRERRKELEYAHSPAAR